MKPLADRLRPEKLSEVAGQKHLIGEGKILTGIIESGNIPNMIFYGPSGSGKTTIANIIAANTGKQLFRLNATTASVSDIKDVINSAGGIFSTGGTLLYLDEIQHFNKKQQQTLLEYMENGNITLIASTTENPYFYIYNAVLSRSVIFEFKLLSEEDITELLVRAVNIESKDTLSGFDIEIEDGALEHIARVSFGDARKALNMLEVLLFSSKADGGSKINITLEAVSQVTQRKALNYDKDGDSHYDIISAFQKSIRGSDPDAAVHYLARLIIAEDIQIICRRLLVTAAEDIGLAYPQAIAVVKACVDSALQLGFPEARIPLSEAVILLATAPKSNSAINAIDAAIKDISDGVTGDIPAHLKDTHYKGSAERGHGEGYKYPHSYENHYIRQQYLPDDIRDRHYYEYGPNKTEMLAKEYWRKIKGE
ncbi:MAG: replication-associated recombination protein A [Oscillospiraceae bacterium]|nr:replication-associated recombination protein A [Oscillospiraceae bacterium]